MSTLRKAREAAGLTQRAVAAAIGVSHAFYGDVERGSKTFAKARCVALLDAVPGLTWEDLAGHITPRPLDEAAIRADERTKVEAEVLEHLQRAASSYRDDMWSALHVGGLPPGFAAAEAVRIARAEIEQGKHRAPGATQRSDDESR